MSASISSSQLKYLDRLADYPSSGKDYLFEIPISSHRIPKCIDEYPIEVANFALKEFETGSQRPVMGVIIVTGKQRERHYLVLEQLLLSPLKEFIDQI